MMDEKKPDLTLVIGGKPKGEMAGSEEPAGGDQWAMCGKALISAIKRGDGAGVMDALEECVAMIDGGDESEEPPEEEETPYPA